MVSDIKGAVLPLLASTVSNRRHQKQLASQLFWEKKKRVTSGRNTGFGFGSYSVYGPALVFLITS